MDWRKNDDRRRTGSVKAAIDMYGGKIPDVGSSSLKKPQPDSPEVNIQSKEIKTSLSFFFHLFTIFFFLLSVMYL